MSTSSRTILFHGILAAFAYTISWQVAASIFYWILSGRVPADFHIFPEFPRLSEWAVAGMFSALFVSWAACFPVAKRFYGAVFPATFLVNVTIGWGAGLLKAYLSMRHSHHLFLEKLKSIREFRDIAEIKITSQDIEVLTMQWEPKAFALAQNAFTYRLLLVTLIIAILSILAHWRERDRREKWLAQGRETTQERPPQ